MKERVAEEIYIAPLRTVVEKIVSKMTPGDLFSTAFPDCDFAFANGLTESTLSEVESKAEDWFGIKAVDAGFDSNCLCLVVDYYGGGCAQMIQIEEEDSRDAIETAILNGIIRAYDYAGYVVGKNLYLVAEFLGKGEKS